MRGMLGTPKVEPFRRQIGSYVHRSLNTFAVIAKVLNLSDLFEDLVEKRKVFEKTAAYQE